MKLPRFLTRPETRAENYTDAIIQGMLAAASGDGGNGLTAAVEIAAGWWQRAFASAELKPTGIISEAIQPHLGFIGRSLIKDGQAVFALDFSAGFRLLPASTVQVSGGPNPDSWTYELTLSGPSETITRTVPSGAVLHLVYASNAGSPERGVSPIEASATTKKLLTSLEQRLGEEANSSTGFVIPVPNVESSSQLQDDLRGLRGKIALVQSTSGSWGEGHSTAPLSDYPIRRIGADPPETLIELRRQVEQSILASCGVPTSVLDGGQGTASREAYRQFLHLSVGPVAKQVGAQIAAAFDLANFEFSFDRLGAADISGRSRAVGSLTQAGMSLEDALKVVMITED